MARALVTVKATPDTRLRIKRMALEDRKIRAHLRRRINKAVKPLAPSVKDRALSHGRGELFTALAAAVRKRVSFAGGVVTAEISVRMGGYANLARAVEGVIPWHHPVYGHAPYRVPEAPKSFFFDTIDRQEPEVTREIEEILDDINKDL